MKETVSIGMKEVARITEADLTEKERAEYQIWLKAIETRWLEKYKKDAIQVTMKVYEDDLPTYWKDGWTVNMVATGIEMGML